MKMSFENKKLQVLKNCMYGVTHFCDGTVNKSQIEEGEEVKPLPPCPKFGRCELSKIVIEGSKE